MNQDSLTIHTSYALTLLRSHVPLVAEAFEEEYDSIKKCEGDLRSYVLTFGG